jgi:hypothetical protein
MNSTSLQPAKLEARFLGARSEPLPQQRTGWPVQAKTQMQSNEVFDYRGRLRSAFAEQTEWLVVERERQRNIRHAPPETSWEDLARAIADERRHDGIVEHDA